MSSANESSQEVPGSSLRQSSSSCSSRSIGSDLKADSSRHQTQKMVARSPEDMNQEAEEVADSSANRTDSKDATREADEWLRAKEDAHAKIAARDRQRRRRPAQLLDEARRKPRNGESATPSKTSSPASSDADGVSDGDARLHREMRLLERAQRRGESPRDSQSAAGGDSLSSVDEEDLEEAGDVLQTDSEQSSPEPTPPSTESRDTQIDDSDMIAAFTEEFGEVGPHTDSNESTGGETETWIGAISSVLLHHVVLRGSLILTSHRIGFVALFDASTAHRESNAAAPDGRESTADGENSIGQGSEVLRRGPAVLHFPGWKRRRTAWFELRVDSLICYKNSTSLYQPLGSGRLSDMTLLPLERRRRGEKRGKSTTVHLRGPLGTYALEYHSHETANAWHKDISAAMWAYSCSRERIRVAVPLERIANYKKDPRRRYMNIHFDALGETHELLDSSPNESLSFGVLSIDAPFIERFEELLDQARDRRKAMGEDIMAKQIHMPIIELEADKGKSRTIRETSANQDAEGLTAQIVQGFTLDDDPAHLKVATADLRRFRPLSGTIAIAQDFFIFWRRRLPPFRDVRIKVPRRDVVSAEECKSLRWHHYGLRVTVRAQPSLHFDFKNISQRDLVLSAIRMFGQEDRAPRLRQHDDAESFETGDESHDETRTYRDPIQTLLKPNRAQGPTTLPYRRLQQMPRIVNPGRHHRISVQSMRVICLTIGSRGDVQPYIALSKALRSQGHSPCILSHPEYRQWVEGHGIEFREAGGDPGALMKLSVEHRLFSPSFFTDALGKFRQWLDDLLRDSYEQCWDAELIIESPSTMSGIHIAEALQCYYFRAFTMPWTRTKHLPQAFSVPPVDLGETYNWSSYTLFDRVFWQAMSFQVNRWRRNMLGLKATSFAQLDQDSVPFLYNFSSAVVPHPNDWDDHIAVTGYWQLDQSQGEDWKPSEELSHFIQTARREDKKLVYIGFGSITVPKANKVTRNIFAAVENADVRAIVAKGWSGRGESDHTEESQPPPSVHVVDAIPHDWLFPKIDVAMHHGGAGSTGASLQAGLVTLIHPFFGDQFFWSQRVHSLGAGQRVASLDEDDITSALRKATTDRLMREKAGVVGDSIRAESGVDNAIAFIESHLVSSKRPYHPLGQKKRRSDRTSSPSDDDDDDAEDEDDAENLEQIRKDSKALMRASSIKGFTKKAIPSSSPFKLFTGSSNSTSQQSADDGADMAGSRSSGLTSNMMSHIRYLVPGLHDLDPDEEDKEKKGSDGKRQGSKADKDEEERARLKKERKSAKAEDRRRRSAMEPKLEQRRKMLEDKARENDSGGED